jgi:hypothetical protein
VTRPMVFRSVAWYGDGPGSWSFQAVPPPGYEGYKVTGILRYNPESAPEFELVEVIDRVTGAQVTARDEVVTSTATPAATLTHVRNLWRDGRARVGFTSGSTRSMRPGLWAVPHRLPLPLDSPPGV